ncbi:MAG: nucleotidyltransferase family protein [Pseudomonadota bacterium]
MTAILLAAGASSRMRGQDKLLQQVRGRPLIVDRADCLTAGARSDTIVVLRADRPARRAALSGRPGLRLIDAPNPDAGMGASIAAGIAAIADQSTAALILPADMPDISGPDIQAMRNAHALSPHAILRGATADGAQGHPVLFPRAYFSELMQLAGDEGARSILRRYMDQIQTVTLSANAALLDLDTPEAWDAWHAAQA